MMALPIRKIAQRGVNADIVRHILGTVGQGREALAPEDQPPGIGGSPVPMAGPSPTPSASQAPSIDGLMVISETLRLIQQGQTQQTQMMASMMQQVSAPKRVIRDPVTNAVVGVETAGREQQ